MQRTLGEMMESPGAFQALRGIDDSLKKLSNPLVKVITDEEAKRRVAEKFTLRDFFAGCALMGMRASDRPPDDVYDIIHAAEVAFEQADAMLKAREGE